MISNAICILSMASCGGVIYTDDLRRDGLAGIQVDTFRPRTDQRLLIGSCQFGLARQTVP